MVSVKELMSRWGRARTLLGRFIPQAGGMFVFSRLNIYYFTGSFANGVFWLPLDGDPVLFCRRGEERVRIESPMDHVISFNTYRDIGSTLNDLGRPLPPTVGAEMNGLSWSLANSLVKHLPDQQFVPADKTIGMCRSRKSEQELAIIREAGLRHDKCLTSLLPPFLHEGMNELEISHKIMELFLAEGHLGMLRMENYGEEVFLGHISVGDSANYPSVFNGPVGLRGAHPAVPYMGSPDVVWKAGKPLTVDNGFTFAGYMTDKTQVYWLGKKEGIPKNAYSAHNFCIELQDMIASLLKPGNMSGEIWRQCLELVEQTGWLEGFMGLGRNKVSFVGHGIGLAIDEYPVLAKGFDLPLEEGMTIAVEPKIGIPGFGMVGVENTYEITAGGGKCLTGSSFDILCV